MNDGKVSGSLEVLHSLQISEGIEGLDQANKQLLKNKEVLAIILKGVVREYAGYSCREIMDFIEGDSIRDGVQVTTGRTNTLISGDNVEFAALNEKLSVFDTVFRSVNPELSNQEIIVNLHIDIEPQRTLAVPYPIEKRGIYYLAREISSQLSLVKDEGTDYNQIEKSYSIWLCRDDIPKGEEFSVSILEMNNTKNYGNARPKKENYDLMTLVIIRLGNSVFKEVEDKGINSMMEFVHSIMYPHREDFMDIMKKHIDFSDNKDLWKEIEDMSGLGYSILQEGRQEGLREGRQEGLREEKTGIVIRLLRKNKSFEEIEDLTGYPEEFIRQVETEMMTTV